MKYILISVAVLGFIISSCEDEEEQVDPRIHILGRWENTESGNWPNMYSYEASGYTEYREDSVALYFDYSKNAYTSQTTYWITDSMVIEKEPGTNGKEHLFRRRYQMRKNWMRMDFVDLMAMNMTAVYRKIE